MKGTTTGKQKSDNQNIIVLIFFSALLLSFTVTSAQTIRTQTIRGNITDEASRYAVAGAVVSVDTLASVITDSAGNFILRNVPLGRCNLIISHIGYEQQTVPDVLVTAGKEVVLNILMTEKIGGLREVIVKAKGKRTLTNEMATVSASVFNPGDTRKYAGALGDPSRMISSMAGVASASDTRNDIVVRGNSPMGLLWQMEGIDIPNPNHYGSLTSTGGPVSILNSNNLGKSDFFTGAFPAQYGNALASVFDLHLRNGNADKNEMIGEISFTGFEAGAEGPLSKKSGASYIINYRYSTVGILNKLGFNIGTGTASPLYQDVNFKVYVPLSEKNKLSIWGLGGPSKITFLGNDIDTAKNNNAYGDENENLYTKYFKAIFGINLETNFSSKTYGKLSLGYSRSTELVNHDSISIQTREAFRNWTSDYKTNQYELSYFLSHKFSAKDNINAGTSASLYGFNLYNANTNSDGSATLIQINQQENMALLQAFLQWKHRFTEKLFFTLGGHYQQLTFNNTFAVEPRAGLHYDINNKQSISLGYGLHSKMQSPVIYLYQTHEPNGDVVYTNTDLGFTKANHFVIGYSNKLLSDLLLRVEAYYQQLYHVPVTLSPSGFSMLNEGADFGLDLKDSLVNKGSGKNYGVELTVEKYFTHRYYFLITASLFNSKYKGSDGVERNTAFNTHYAANILAGKDFVVGKNKNTLSFNFKVTSVGGKYTSPVDVAASAASDETKYDETIAPFSLHQQAYFRTDIKIGYRKNYKKATLEAGMDLQNVTGHKNIFSQTYDARTQQIVYQYQQGFLPVPYFRFTF